MPETLLESEEEGTLALPCVLAAGQRRLHGRQRLHSGDRNRLSPAGNPRRRGWRSGGGLGNWSLPFGIEHQYSVAFPAPRFFQSEFGILTDSPAHQTCRAGVCASRVAGYTYEVVGGHSSILIARNPPKWIVPRGSA